MFIMQKALCLKILFSQSKKHCHLYCSGLFEASLSSVFLYIQDIETFTHIFSNCAQTLLTIWTSLWYPVITSQVLTEITVFILGSFHDVIDFYIIFF
jgi:hypothetical protein